MTHTFPSLFSRCQGKTHLLCFVYLGDEARGKIGESRLEQRPCRVHLQRLLERCRLRGREAPLLEQRPEPLRASVDELHGGDHAFRADDRGDEGVVSVSTAVRALVADADACKLSAST